MSKREWWYPQTKKEMADELREEHPEQKELSDQEILDQFDISDIKYVTTWDNIGDAQEQFEEVADRLLEQEEDIKRLRGLLRESQDYVEAGISSVDTELCDRIAKELGDE